MSGRAPNWLDTSAIASQASLGGRELSVPTDAAVQLPLHLTSPYDLAVTWSCIHPRRAPISGARELETGRNQERRGQSSSDDACTRSLLCHRHFASGSRVIGCLRSYLHSRLGNESGANLATDGVGAYLSCLSYLASACVRQGSCSSGSSFQTKGPTQGNRPGRLSLNPVGCA